MNSGGGKTPSTPRRSEYATNALEKIRKELNMFSSQGNDGGHGSGVASPQVSNQNLSTQQNQIDINMCINHLINSGYSEEQALNAFKITNGRVDTDLDYLQRQNQLRQSQPHESPQINGHPGKVVLPPALAPKLIRKHSIERELPPSLQYHRGSPALDSGAGSSRSNSPHSHQAYTSGRASTGQYSPSPCPSTLSDAPPAQLPTPPPVTATNFQQMFKRYPPAPPPTRPVALPSQSPARGTSPVSNSSHRPIVAQNGPQAQQQLNQQMKALSLYQSGSNSGEPPPPYPILSTTGSSVVGGGCPPSYSVSIQNRQSPTQTNSDYRKSPSSGIYSATSAGSPSPITVTQTAILPPYGVSMARPTAMSWGPSWQTKTHSPIIMQSVKSTQVQKPVLQTAIAPQVPAPSSPAVGSHGTPPPAPPSYATSIQQKSQQKQQQQQQQQQSPHITAPTTTTPRPPSTGHTPPTTPPVLSQSNGSASTTPIPTTEPPSYASTMAFMAAVQQQPRQLPPPPPYITNNNNTNNGGNAAGNSTTTHHQMLSQQQHTPPPPPPTTSKLYPYKIKTPPLPPTSSSSVKSSQMMNGGGLPASKGRPPTANPSKSNSNSNQSKGSSNGSATNNNNTTNSSSSNKKVGSNSSSGEHKIKHESPIPKRKKISIEKEEERKECRIRHYSPQAYKFFMEQHIENVMKSYRQRAIRKNQLEKEMVRINLSKECQVQMRKMLCQKESNYIRLKRAKMDASMFVKLQPIGLGAFGEVTLVRKIDTVNHLYAMKTLRKADVLKRNQVAHVKAERDILAEADNEWVVKLYYSFQDKENLYFVMDYIPGGDLMALLIKKGIFDEPLARFYIAELTCAVESVHKMGFIHRDIKPDNILIGHDGHIKLTDFGLCTGFRWTHNSKYYQKIGDHARQDSMEPWEDVSSTVLERRRQRENQRCLAHSLVGTPNYIAPEVLQRSGYTQLCDWWSVGVILYEMLVGQPPFSANTPVETQQKVIRWENSLIIPPEANLSKPATDLIRRLCCASDKRMGKNADEVKQHSFFNGVDFKTDLRQQTAPFIPTIQHPTDTSNFDPIDPDKLRTASSDSFDGSDESFHGFLEFTFRRFFTDDKDDKADLDNFDNNSGGDDLSSACYV